MGRAPCCDKATVKKGPWSPEEDAVLKNYIQENGTGGNWIALPHKIGLKRCGKSCRLRWLNYLRPNIKHGDFTPEEDSIICRLYISIGSRWSIIAAQLPGRTDNDVKNYWNTKLKKRLFGRRKDRDTPRSTGLRNEPSNEIIEGDRCTQTLSASALERIQLCMQLQELHNPLGFHHNPLLWPDSKRVTQSENNNSSSNTNVTVADHSSAQNGQGQFSSLSEHLMEQLEKTALDSLSSPSSAANSNVMTVEAELQELLYSEENRTKANELEGIKELDVQQENMDWWAYDQDKSPVNSWAYSPDPSSLLFQDYTSTYGL